MAGGVQVGDGGKVLCVLVTVRSKCACRRDQGGRSSVPLTIKKIISLLSAYYVSVTPPRASKLKDRPSWDSHAAGAGKEGKVAEDGIA